MADDILFTIVIPTRQEAGYIGQSLRHLRAERARGSIPFDVVVVDGCSTDKTVDEATGLADKIIIESAEERIGIARARNVGAASTRSPFLFHTDADVLAPDLVELFDRALKAFSDPSVVAITTPVMPYPWDSTRRDRIIHILANRYFRELMRFGAPFSRGECQIVRTSAFNEIGGYNIKFISGEDCDLFRRLNRIGRIFYISDSCVYHSVRRFRRTGYVRMLAIYIREWLWTITLRRSYISEWPVVR